MARLQTTSDVENISFPPS